MARRSITSCGWWTMTGAKFPKGTDGEILVRGPAMFLGYADEAQTRESLTEDGFFRTGDIGRITPSGALVITGRKKDLIIRGGENISAKEIEDVLHLHAGIKEAAVVSMPHPRLGEGICAYLIAAGEDRPDMATLIRLRQRSGPCQTEMPRTHRMGGNPAAHRIGQDPQGCAARDDQGAG